MKENPKGQIKLSRRDFLKLTGAATMMGWGVYSLYKELGIDLSLPERQIENPFIAPHTDPFVEPGEVVEGKVEATSEEKLEPTPTNESQENEVVREEAPLTFGVIDFKDSKSPISMNVFMKDESVIPVNAFTSMERTIDINEWEVFRPKDETALAETYGPNGITLWAHSGRRNAVDLKGYTMRKLQEYFERGGGDYKIAYWDIADFFKNTVLDSLVLMDQGGRKQVGVIKGAVRIPPNMVWQLKKNITRFPDWIRENFEGTGFENVSEGKRTIFPIFCGEILAGEKAEEDIPYYMQSRFILAIEEA